MAHDEIEKERAANRKSMLADHALDTIGLLGLLVWLGFTIATHI